MITVHQLFRANLDRGVLRVWTGTGDLSFAEPYGIPASTAGKTEAYDGGAGFMSTEEDVARFTMRGVQFAGTPLGGRQVDVFHVGSLTGEPPWVRVPFSLSGVLDSPRLYEGRFSVAIVALSYDRPPETWSNEEHQARFPGDTFFSQMKALSRGIRGTWFPNVPDFNPAEDYNTRNVQGVAPADSQGAPTSAPGMVFRAGATVRLTPSVDQLPPGR